MAIHPVILSGGAGTRMWPHSRASYPKQLLALNSELSLLQETALRLQNLADASAPVLVCNDEHRFLVAEQMREIGIKPAAIYLEPIGRNTAAAVAVAALGIIARDPEAILVVLPSDHIVRDDHAFGQVAMLACNAARQGHIAMIGIVPGSPHTGYGYIQTGEPMAGLDGCHAVSRFVEKPDRQKAEGLVASGVHLWNSGMFVLGAATYLAELGRLAPQIVSGSTRALEEGADSGEFFRLDKKSFGVVPSISIDYAVMEHTGLGVVLPADIGWSDVGSWDALWDIQDKTHQGNVIRGDVVSENVTNSLVSSQSRLVAALGVTDLVIVETADAVLVAHRSAAQDVKRIVDRMQSEGRTEHITHKRVYRPWGYYESVDSGDRFQVKRIMVNPGARLSLQMHHHRAEHWIVVSGTARVTRGEQVELVSENQSTYIPIGVNHRLENPGKVMLHLIEVQSGCYLGEDDIVRLEDSYHRV
ncbi:MAG: mannose-1-phosphate guanylyltransferase/mannose-6-phosphate isomerase [Betaproteobacteria bacterium]